jgi:DNA-directed RNA polymerase specialized sigma subunit
MTNKERIIELLKNPDLSMTEIGRIVGVSKAYVSNINKKAGKVRISHTTEQEISKEIRNLLKNTGLSISDIVETTNTSRRKVIKTYNRAVKKDIVPRREKERDVVTRVKRSKIRKVLKDKNLSLSQVAKICNVSHSVVENVRRIDIRNGSKKRKTGKKHETNY